jgi:ribosome-binding protein aMBF1 (putative translation factor)
MSDDGQIRCEVCGKWFAPDDMWTDEDGNVLPVCVQCAEAEPEVIES